MGMPKFMPKDARDRHQTKIKQARKQEMAG
jgi:hypothetical protein